MLSFLIEVLAGIVIAAVLVIFIEEGGITGIFKK